MNGVETSKLIQFFDYYIFFPQLNLESFVFDRLILKSVVDTMMLIGSLVD